MGDGPDTIDARRRIISLTSTGALDMAHAQAGQTRGKFGRLDEEFDRQPDESLCQRQTARTSEGSLRRACILAYECLDLLCEGDYLKYNIWVSVTDDSRALSFLQRFFLHWLEALSLMGRVHEAVRCISELKSCVDPIAGACMVSFLSDAECFIDSFRPAIESAPLQVYHSGLVFAPKNSIIRGTFGDSAPRWVENIWPLQEEWNERVQLLEGHHGPVTTISLPDDDRFLASGSADGSIKIWDLSHGKCLHTLHENDGAVNATAFSTNGAQVASASSDIISVWDAGSGRRLQSFSGHDGSIRLLSFSQDDQKLISYSFDRTIRTWSLRTGLCTESIATTSPACSATFSSDGQRIALGLFDDAVIEVWNLSPGRRPSIIRGRRSSVRDDAVRTSAFSVRAIAFSQSGEQLVSCSSDKIIKLWNTTTLHCTKTLAINDIVHSIAFAPDGRRLVVSVDSTNDAVRVCDLRTGRISQTMQSHDGPVCKAVFSTDGKRLISASFDGSVRIWPAESSHPYGSHLGYGGKTDSLALSSGGRWFASASEQDGYRLRIWNTANVEDVQELHGHNSSVRAIDFSANDQWLASGSANGTTRIWDVSRGRCVRLLTGQAQPVHSVAFSPNIRSLISGLEDGTVELWDLLHGSCWQFLLMVDGLPRVRVTAWSKYGARISIWRATRFCLVGFDDPNMGHFKWYLPAYN
ncbi:hypothetical protein Purlil1_14133 [Purpureocillium lilacinum]|uniref:WD40 repeat-like protein n=1 Tax=Purpureocillium lilacinum TaxID=33203 RepID=A0ABR0BC47_PURLI|nr:hypothetical protein Purlil1_14133 [Purpureocillium lilacinum]